MSCDYWIVVILPCLLLMPQTHARFIDSNLGLEWTELEPKDNTGFAHDAGVNVLPRVWFRRIVSFYGSVATESYDFSGLENVETGVFNCSSKLECPSGYCCTGLMVLENDGLGLCKRYKNIGDHCMEKLFPGDMVCPCARGLTCTRDPFSEDGVHTCETVALHQEPWAMFKEKM